MYKTSEKLYQRTQSHIRKTDVTLQLLQQQSQAGLVQFLALGQGAAPPLR